MTGLRQFISQEVKVKIAQGQLHELLLVNAQENREDVVSLFALCSLKDDPIVGEPSWSFLKDSRNIDLQGHERWLLNRVASTDWLRDEFFVKSAKWSRNITFSWSTHSFTAFSYLSNKEKFPFSDRGVLIAP
jgi:hypothetical protein